MTVIDLVYNPHETRLLREAKQAGAQTLFGLPMLIYQGVAALELWSGRKLNIGEISNELQGRLLAALQSRK
jgi:shikimate dehydrogenase